VSTELPLSNTLVNVTSLQIERSWDRSLDREVVGYKMYRDVAQIGAKVDTSYEDAGLSSDMMHHSIVLKNITWDK